jgi:hypothetical protein
MMCENFYDGKNALSVISSPSAVLRMDSARNLLGAASKEITGGLRRGKWQISTT